MGYRALELVIQSAQGLRNVHNVPQLRKLNPFALVSIRDNNNNLQSSEVQTPIDSQGNTNPKWNFHVTFNIDIMRVKENHLALVVNLKSRRIHGNRDVGEVRVLINELEGFGDANAVAERLIKNVVNLDGTSQQGEGRLNFSYKWGEVEYIPERIILEDLEPLLPQELERNSNSWRINLEKFPPLPERRDAEQRN